MKIERLLVLGLLFLPTAMLGCGGSDAGCVEGEIECDGECLPEIAPTLESVHAGVFKNSCALDACHGGKPGKGEGLNLEFGRTFVRGTHQPIFGARSNAKSCDAIKRRQFLFDEQARRDQSRGALHRRAIGSNAAAWAIALQVKN